MWWSYDHEAKVYVVVLDCPLNIDEGLVWLFPGWKPLLLSHRKKRVKNVLVSWFFWSSSEGCLSVDQLLLSAHFLVIDLWYGFCSKRKKKKTLKFNLLQIREMHFWIQSQRHVQGWVTLSKFKIQYKFRSALYKR